VSREAGHLPPGMSRTQPQPFSTRPQRDQHPALFSSFNDPVGRGSQSLRLMTRQNASRRGS